LYSIFLFETLIMHSTVLLGFISPTMGNLSLLTRVSACPFECREAFEMGLLD